MKEDANNLHGLTALSPLDGRYAAKLPPALFETFSEYGLLKHRAEVELRWLLELAANPQIKEVPPLDAASQKKLKGLWENFSAQDAAAIKETEKKILHDLKSLEIWLVDKIQATLGAKAKDYVPFVHFGCTSEDINNLAYALMLKQGRELLLQKLQLLRAKLVDLADQDAELPMTARTHGQEATPTTWGKEMAVFAYRLHNQIVKLGEVGLNGKFNGATGNYSAWHVAYPDLDWQKISENFVAKSLKLNWRAYSTQIESHDGLAELLHGLARSNMILVDMCRDIWGYCSLGYLQLEKRAEEVGSSTMPHKINPEKFETAESNLELAASQASFLAGRLQVSRWQRDLSDSSLQRNLGNVFGHSILGYVYCLDGLTRVKPNAAFIKKDLAERWALLSEAVQTLMRRHKQTDAYEKVKQAVRGEKPDKAAYERLVKAAGLDAATEKRLLQLTPEDYVGLAPTLAKQVKQRCK